MAFDALHDSGSPICLVKERFIPRDYVIVDNESNQFYGMNENELEIIGRIEGSIILDRVKHKVISRIVPGKTMQNPMI